MSLNLLSSSLRDPNASEKIVPSNLQGSKLEGSSRDTPATLNNRSFKPVKQSLFAPKETRGDPLPKRNHAVKKNSLSSQVAVNEAGFTQATPLNSQETTEQLANQRESLWKLLDSKKNVFLKMIHPCKKGPEYGVQNAKIIKVDLARLLVKEYQLGHFEDANHEAQCIRRLLTPKLVVSIDKSVINTLQANKNQAAVKEYQDNLNGWYPANHALNSHHEPQKMAEAFKAYRKHQQASQSSAYIDTNAFRAEQQAARQMTKESAGVLERALPLVDHSKVTQSGILKTIAASGALAIWLTAPGAWIATLVKFGQSESAEEQASVDEPDSDHTKAIETKKNEIKTKQNSFQTLKDKEQALLDKGENLPEDDIKREAALASFEQLYTVQSDLKEQQRALEALKIQSEIKPTKKESDLITRSDRKSVV